MKISSDTPCPKCRTTMRLFGAESDPAHPDADVLTFECPGCGNVTTQTAPREGERNGSRAPRDEQP